MNNNGLPQVTINRTSGAFGRNIKEDGICGFITVVSASAIPTIDGSATYTLGTTLKLTSLRLAELTYGINKEYDLNNSVLVWHHLREFFRLGGQEIYIMLVSDAIATTQDALVDVANTGFASKLLADAGGRVRCLGVGYNVSAAPLAGNSMAQMSEDAIIKAQALAEQEWAYKRPVDVIIEGLNFLATPALADDLHDKYDCRDVSVIIAQDGTIADLDSNFEYHATVGTALGLYAARNVHESIGWVEYGNIADTTSNIYTDTRISGNTTLSAYTEVDKDLLDDKGFMFARTFSNFNGVYLNDDHTCAALTDDFQYIHYNRAIKKAARSIYRTLVPKLNKPVLINDNGRLQIGERKLFEGLVKETLLSDMSGEIIDIGKVIVDPAFDENNQPYPSFNTDPTLRVLVAIKPYGKVEQIIVNLGFEVAL